MHVDDAAINERLHLDPAVLDLVGRMGGLSYCRTRDRFDLRMGRCGAGAGFNWPAPKVSISRTRTFQLGDAEGCNLPDDMGSIGREGGRSVLADRR